MSNVTLLVIGDETVVYGFGLLGIEGRIVHSAQEADAALSEAVNNQAANDRASNDPGAQIVLVTAQWAEQIRARVDALKAASLYPLVLELPYSAGGATEQADLRTLLQHALGLSLERV